MDCFSHFGLNQNAQVENEKGHKEKNEFHQVGQDQTVQGRAPPLDGRKEREQEAQAEKGRLCCQEPDEDDHPATGPGPLIPDQSSIEEGMGVFPLVEPFEQMKSHAEKGRS
jgi:hypothetical protein